MAAAGPAANLLIAALALVALRVGLAWEVFEPPLRLGFNPSFAVLAEDPFMQNVGRFLGILLALNAILCVLNLLPVPPLDGSSALGVVLPPSLVNRFKETLMSGGLASVLFAVIFLFFGRVFVGPIFDAIEALLYPISAA
jgi:Zn-dependent protease